MKKTLEEGSSGVEGEEKASDAVAIISYDEKPGIQAIATTAPDLWTYKLDKAA